MIDMGSIAAAVASLKTATDIAKTISELKVGAEVQGKVIDLQREIMAAQSSALAAQSDQFTLLHQIRELEQRIREIEGWEREKHRYVLVKLYQGSLAYIVKEESRGSEPRHYICAACYQEGKKSILQGFTSGYGEHVLTCPRCNTKVTHSYDPMNFTPVHTPDYDPY
jgi:hypothetical protein